MVRAGLDGSGRAQARATGRAWTGTRHTDGGRAAGRKACAGVSQKHRRGDGGSEPRLARSCSRNAAQGLRRAGPMEGSFRSEATVRCSSSPTNSSTRCPSASSCTRIAAGANAWSSSTRARFVSRCRRSQARWRSKAMRRSAAFMKRHRQRSRLAEEIGHAIARRGGAALIIDYGYDRPGFGETLQAVGKHQFKDVLDSAGRDRSHSACRLHSLRGRGAARRRANFGPIGQGQFLERLGIGARAEKLAQLNKSEAPCLLNRVERDAGRPRLLKGGPQRRVGVEVAAAVPRRHLYGPDALGEDLGPGLVLGPLAVLGGRPTSSDPTCLLCLVPRVSRDPHAPGEGISIVSSLVRKEPGRVEARGRVSPERGSSGSDRGRYAPAAGRWRRRLTAQPSHAGPGPRAQR